VVNRGGRRGRRERNEGRRVEGLITVGVVGPPLIVWSSSSSSSSSESLLDRWPPVGFLCGGANDCVVEPMVFASSLSFSAAMDFETIIDVDFFMWSFVWWWWHCLRGDR
jgi:hypothetical protein